jgi:hypothetical protein
LTGLLDENDPSTPIRSAINAAALANLAREREDGSLMLFSKKAYVKAIRSLNAALGVSDDSNSTIASILVLSLFEALSYEGNVCSVERFNAHNNGTLCLLKTRGLDLLKTEAGKQIYIHIVNNIRSSCYQFAIPVPPAFVEINKVMEPYLANQHHSMAVWAIGDELVDLRLMTTSKQDTLTITY